MKYSIFFFAALAAAFAGTSPANAASVSILSMSDDLEALPVGTKVTFGVQLDGLSAGQAIDLLTVNLQYDDALLGLSGIDLGPIVSPTSWRSIRSDGV